MEPDQENPPASGTEAGEADAQTPPDTSDHPSHEEQVGGRGADDPAELADEARYRKGPGW